ncbi:MAG: 8-oxo-dGTP diphosphatase [Clostridiales bacterium]|nr:8-oxo-dGTP diphosphatase [Clostridiales bacterium]
MRIVNTTLLFLVQDGKILLAEKKRGFGAGKINGVGGKIENGETVESAMIREAQEEIGIKPTKYKEMANITFDEYFAGEKEKVVMSVFVASEYEGVISESDEMKPYWYGLNSIPYDKMFVDDKYWLPHVLDNHFVTAEFDFDEHFNIINSNIAVK